MVPAKQKLFAHLVILLQFISGIVCIFIFNGTADSGDSIYHYLFARYAPSHIENYFDHWAKPVFVLLASPFAHFGFAGMKLFNVSVSVASSYFTWKTAERMGLKNNFLVPVFLLCSSLNFTIMFSGFTEPLFALFTVLGIYFVTIRRAFVACVIISFLPYVRSEGLIIIGVFGVYFLFAREWRMIPALLLGSLLYAVAGYYVHHDLLWVYTKIPYAKLSSVYGHGTITHFFEQMIYVVGIPVYALFWIGFVFVFVKTIQKKISMELTLLFLFGFLCYFTAHTLFWWLGIFNSYGLKRVLIGIMPIIAIISLCGFNFITEELLGSKLHIKKRIAQALMLYTVVFPFTSNPAAIQREKDLMLGKDLYGLRMACDTIDKQKINYPLVYNHHYIGMIFDIDPFDVKYHRNISRAVIEEMKSGQYLVWDTVYSLNDCDIGADELEQRKDLEKIKEINVKWNGPENIFRVYRKK